MDVAAADRLLTTTRSVRKRLDVSRPVEPAVIARCIEIALQAPTGSNAQGWSFVVVTDAAKRKGLADLYKRAFQLYAGNPDLHPQYAADDPRGQQMPRVLDSATWLAEHLHEVCRCTSCRASTDASRTRGRSRRRRCTGRSCRRRGRSC